jgi:hypothetical protein
MSPTTTTAGPTPGSGAARRATRPPRPQRLDLPNCQRETLPPRKRCADCGRPLLSRPPA